MSTPTGPPSAKGPKPDKDSKKFEAAMSDMGIGKFEGYTHIYRDCRDESCPFRASAHVYDAPDGTKVACVVMQLKGVAGPRANPKLFLDMIVSDKPYKNPSAS